MSNLENKIELGLITAIIVVVGFILFQPKVVYEDSKPTLENFYEFPLQAWLDEDKGGDVQYWKDKIKELQK